MTQEALAGVRVVRAYRQEARELARFRDANLEYVQRNRALIRLQGLFYPSMGFFMGCAEMLVLWRGSLRRDRRTHDRRRARGLQRAIWRCSPGR